MCFNAIQGANIILPPVFFHNVQKESHLRYNAEPHWHTGQNENDGEQFATLSATDHVTVT